MSREPSGRLYVLRFEPPFKQGNKEVHYRLGCTSRDLSERLREHLSGSGNSAAMVRAAMATKRKVYLHCVAPGNYKKEAAYKRWHNVRLVLRDMHKRGHMPLEILLFDGEKPCQIPTGF